MPVNFCFIASKFEMTLQQQKKEKDFLFLVVHGVKLNAIVISN